MKRSVRMLAATFSVLLVLPSVLSAQTGSGWNPAPLQATRTQLEEILKQYEASSRSRAYSPKLRERARYEASLVRQRLDEGDFQVGDRIHLFVENEPTLSDTLVVTSDVATILPSGDTISLKKVLRSELTPKLQQAIARVVKNPTVRTETFLRIGILGAVGQQGFFELRSDALLTDVLNKVGLPNTALLDKMRIERNRKTIWDGQPLRDALSEGRTLDQLSLRAGDVLNVPTQGGPSKNALLSARSVLMLIPAIFAIRRAIQYW